MAASKIQTGCQPEALIQIRLLPTAWLYSQFRAGILTLDTGLGSYFDADRLANAGELQNAIGFLEDEGGQNNGYVALAESALGTDLAGIKADSNGAYDVVALNLFDANGNLSQNQLAIVSEAVVPEPSSILLTLVGGVLCAGAYRCRRNKLSGAHLSFYALRRGQAETIGKLGLP